jgi:hypothetical protein
MYELREFTDVLEGIVDDELGAADILGIALHLVTASRLHCARIG